jgi:hypothetical protein
MFAALQHIYAAWRYLPGSIRAIALQALLLELTSKINNI